ncbi:MBL fold metallo-hydrolase [Deferribacter autotrophicus]|uniref:MBL fold metallo-hydrolase n=1 Tax=Deferribacter autotrophicus TaxID=500465 RepID=A0A5A8F7Z3_9BACT|nr:MBL fold metallo-hydrolase [Deferribacter autotrophicus]KAA0258128.1 MBL fold metallo-hydrolase [Deferribacter autotrophicus]
MRIDTIIVGALYVNCYIISKGNDAIVIDPGSDFHKIKEFIVSKSLKPLAILNTHGHFDHVGAIEDVKNEFNVSLYMHKDDEFLLKSAPQHALMFGLDGVKTSKIDYYIEDGEILNFGEINVKVLHTPGHSPGGVCFYIEEINSVFTGDTLFCESVGRTDFPYANFNELKISVQQKLYSLDPETKVYPGHGPSTSIGHERKMNAFIRAKN